MIRKGSLDGLAEEVGDVDLLRMALDDYALSHRRERSSRKDYVLGWAAAIRRLKGDPEMIRKLLSLDLTIAA